MPHEHATVAESFKMSQSVYPNKKHGRQGTMSENQNLREQIAEYIRTVALKAHMHGYSAALDGDDGRKEAAERYVAGESFSPETVARLHPALALLFDAQLDTRRLDKLEAQGWVEINRSADYVWVNAEHGDGDGPTLRAAIDSALP